MIGDQVNDGGGVRAEEVRGRRPVDRENSAGFRREDAGGGPVRLTEWKGDSKQEARWQRE